MKIVEKAIEFATLHHKSMLRKGTKVPYMAHLFNVCRILAERECSDEILAAALLHDIVEDTDVKIEEVEEIFGKDVAELVRGATEKYKLEKSAFNHKDTWQERKEHTLHFIENGASVDQRLLIMADKIDNSISKFRDTQKRGSNLWERFNASKDQQKWYYESLVIAFEKTNDHSSEVYDELLKELRYNVSLLFHAHKVNLN